MERRCRIGALAQLARREDFARRGRVHYLAARAVPSQGSTACATAPVPEYTRIKTDRPDLYRMEHRFNDDRVVSYVFLSWNAYGYALPGNGSVWEFEDVLWARKGLHVTTQAFLADQANARQVPGPTAAQSR